MAYNYDYQHFILVTNAFDGGDNLLFFTIDITLEDIRKTLKVLSIPYNEAYAIPGNELSIHCYDPFYCDQKKENCFREIAATYNEATHGKLITD